MANWDKADPLFRFVQVRAPQTPQRRADERLPSVRAYFSEPTPFHAGLKARVTGSQPDAVLAFAKAFLTAADRAPWGGTRFLSSRQSLPSWLTQIDEVLAAGSDQPQLADLEKALSQILTGAPEFVTDNAFRWPLFVAALERTWHEVADSTIAVSMWPGATAESQATLMRFIRIIGLLNAIVDGQWKVVPAGNAEEPPVSLSSVVTRARVRAFLLDGLVLLPPDIFPLPMAQSRAQSQPAASVRPQASEEPLRVSIVNATEELRRELSAEYRRRLPTLSDVQRKLTARSAEVVRRVGLTENLTIPEVIDALDRRLAVEPSAPLPQAESPRIAAMRVLQLDAGIREAALERGNAFTELVPTGTWSGANLTRSPLVGDLLVVQQELLRYEAGEIADIQNVLAKEKKVRVHEYKETQETETTTIIEREEDRTHDSQTTDRLELSQESSRQAQSQASLEAGVTFSGQWGPVKVGANTQFAYSTSSEESNRSASTFSHEVVDRSVETIKQRRTEQRRQLRRVELLDRNEHTYDNESDTSVVGIYQWVDKVYEAATFNYGQRLMLDVTVPEPSLYWQYANEIAVASKVTAKPPPALAVPVWSNGELVYGEFQPGAVGVAVSIDYLAATYRVRGLVPPPPRWVTASVKLAPDKPLQDDPAKESQGIQSKAVDLKIPKGYVPRWYTAAVSTLVNAAQDEQRNARSAVGLNNKSDMEVYGQNWGNPPPNFIYDHHLFGLNTLSVGPLVDSFVPGTVTTITRTFREANMDSMTAIGESGDVGSEGTLPVALSVLSSPSYAATVTVVCERSEETFHAWQIEQFEKVVTAWETWNQEFELAVRQAANGTRAPSITTNSALANTIVTSELRRLFLEMMHVSVLGLAGAVDPYDLSDPQEPKPPELHAEVAALYGRQIQFVEQAFEWPQLTYRLYPYYWKPRTTWAQAIALQDADPAFAEFLRAGSARLVVPVRPGFELAVCSHLGINPPLPWQAGKPPIVDAEPYLSIAEEIKSSQTTLGQPPRRIDTPWIVRLPTTLVKIKADAELPKFRDATPADPAPGP
jgi:hypothetical protein